MARSVSLLGGLGVGALLMYFLDPDKGKRRRSILRGQGIHLVHETQDALKVGARDLGNRVAGQMVEIQSTLNPEIPLDDILVARVRSKMGRFLSHPSTITVRADEGMVTLEGPILAHEVDRLLRAVRDVRGVLGIVNNLEVHEKAGNIPALQQGSEIPMVGIQRNWPPGIRLLAVVMGGAIALNALRKRGFLGFVGGLAGTLALTRGLSNRPLNHLYDLTKTGQMVNIQKTLNIHAPIEQVFNAWLHLAQNYSQLLPSIRNIQTKGKNRAHWEVVGPLGLTLSGVAVISEIVPNKLIAWKSTENTTVRNCGSIQFDSTPDGGTRVQINLMYRPPLGVISHLLASLLGFDPKHRLDLDLVRMKSAIENEARKGQPSPRIVM